MSDEPIDRFSPEELDRLCLNLDALHQDVERGLFSSRALDSALVQDIHYRLWEGVRSYGGRPRRRGEGPEVLNILGRRSPRGADVPRLLQDRLRKLDVECTKLQAQGADALTIIELATVAHVDLIRLQPFTDGNKRTARLLLSIVLVRCGLNAVNFGVTRQEYASALEAAFDDDLVPMTDLVIDLMARQATP